MSDQRPWTWNTWDYVHCVQCGTDLPARPTCEPEHFCSIQCAYTYGVNFHEQRGAARIAAERVAQVPNGWLFCGMSVYWDETGVVEYEGILGRFPMNPNDNLRRGTGSTWHEALTAACEAAQGVEP